MMANMPPEMPEHMQASMAQRNATGRSRRGGGHSANSIPAHAGVTVPLDSPLYTSFTRLKTQPGYHMVMNMETSDPRMAAIDQSIFSPGRIEVEGNTRQYTMHYKMPATDLPGTVDDWEIQAVVQNGRGASLITSAAVPRINYRGKRSSTSWRSWTAWPRPRSLAPRQKGPWARSAPE